jgi:hypothetical protein
MKFFDLTLYYLDYNTDLALRIRMEPRKRCNHRESRTEDRAPKVFFSGTLLMEVETMAYGIRSLHVFVSF